MSTPADVMAALTDQERAALNTRSNRAGLIRLAKHIGLISALTAYVLSGLPLWWCATLPLGIALVFLFTLQHECTHQTPFATPILNEIVGHACALVLVQPFLWFRAFHMAHHRHTNDPDRDPELQGDAKPDTWTALLWHLSTLGYWAAKARTLLANARGSFDNNYVAPRARSRLMREARMLIAAYVAVVLFTLLINPVLFWVWFLPLVLGFPVLRLYLLAEHGRCPPVTNMFLNSRTTLTNSAINVLAWNMPYHAEHHTYPNIPFHKLPDVHRVTAPHLAQVSDGYVDFTKTYIKPF